MAVSYPQGKIWLIYQKDQFWFDGLQNHYPSNKNVITDLIWLSSISVPGWKFVLQEAETLSPLPYQHGSRSWTNRFASRPAQSLGPISVHRTWRIYWENKVICAIKEKIIENYMNSHTLLFWRWICRISPTPVTIYE